MLCFHLWKAVWERHEAFRVWASADSGLAKVYGP